jgi:hypothetical protein
MEASPKLGPRPQGLGLRKIRPSVHASGHDKVKLIIVLFELVVFIGLEHREVTIASPTVRTAGESDEWN